MAAKFYYVVEGLMMRSKDVDKNPVKIYETFKDDNPITARKKAFTFYQNYVDVFLESLGVKYSSFEEASALLKEFIISDKMDIHMIGDEAICEYDADSDYGLFISIVEEGSRKFISSAGNPFYEEEYIIHSIDSEFNNLKLNRFYALAHEQSLYEKYSYDTEDSISEYDVSKLFEDPIIKKILTTPVDYQQILDDRL
ncbi:MAG: hypothetical protein WBG43_04380 [Marinifilaceae bacterium]